MKRLGKQSRDNTRPVMITLNSREQRNDCVYNGKRLITQNIGVQLIPGRSMEEREHVRSLYEKCRNMNEDPDNIDFTKDGQSILS